MIDPLGAVRTVYWAGRARTSAQRQIPKIASRGLDLPRAPRAGLRHSPWVARVLWRTDATCLVRCAVLQRWYADHGQGFDLVVGVTAPAAGFRAHAWLDQPIPDPTAAEFTELSRWPARDVRR